MESMEAHDHTHTRVQTAQHSHFLRD